MNVGWGYTLREGQRSNPVVYVQKVSLPESIPAPTDDQLKTVFLTEGYNLQTWGRRKGPDGKTILINDPHWIGVCRGTPLHVDPKYPRYSHHLKVRVDPGVFVRGLDKQELELTRGTFYILDTHSPHQVFNKTGGAPWNVAVSIDSPTILDPEQAIQACKLYARIAKVVP